VTGSGTASVIQKSAMTSPIAAADCASRLRPPKGPRKASEAIRATAIQMAADFICRRSISEFMPIVLPVSLLIAVNGRPTVADIAIAD
jgi:hypothetical protein